MSKTLGLLVLENKPLDLPGALCAPQTFEFPITSLTVPGAWVKNILDGDPALSDAYISCAQQLERDGAAAIISNCGFTARFQREVAASVSVPVALSSLLMVPLMSSTLPMGRKVGIVTYDADKLAEHHFIDAGWSSRDIPVAVIGIEGSETWRRLADPIPAVTPELIVRDVMAAVTILLEADPLVDALVLECAAFPPAAARVRLETGLPVADYVTLARTLVDMSP
jgi:Asp/Glu/hydantoin racemase